MEWRRYLPRTNPDRVFDHAFVTFDASALLWLYSFPLATTTSYLAAIAKLREPTAGPEHLQAHVWIAPQAIYEFTRHFTSMKFNAVVEYDTAIAAAEASRPDMPLNNLHELVRQKHMDAFHKGLEKLLKPVVDELKRHRSEIQARNERDPIFDALADLFDETGRCEPTEEEHVWLAKHALERFGLKVPPGFKDQNKSEKTAGQDDHSKYNWYSNRRRVEKSWADLLIWHQILQHGSLLSKENGVTKLVFVTDDAKEDWFHKAKDGSRTAHRLLVQEALDDGLNLHLMGSAEFLERAKSELNITVDDDSLRAVRGVVARYQSKPDGRSVQNEVEVEVSRPNHEEGFIRISFLDPQPNPTVHVWFTSHFSQLPQVSLEAEFGMVAYNCHASVESTKRFVVHLRPHPAPGHLPPGEYIVSYKATCEH